MIDASIYSQIKQPEPDNQLARYGQMLQIQNAQLAGQQGQQAFQTQQEERARQNKLRDLLAGGADPYKAALQVGDLKNAGELAKAQSAVEKDKRESAKLDLEMVQKRMETAGNAFNFVRQNPTIENAHAVLDYLGNNKIFTPEQVVQYKQGLTPENVAQQAEMAVRSVLSTKDQLGKVQQSNLGGTTQTSMFDPLTGQQRILSDVKHTQSPDNAATVAATLRGQNMIDARARETLAQGKWQYDTQRGGLVNMQTGEFKPATQGGAPIGPADKPLPEAAQKQLIGTRNLQDAVGNYLTKLKSFGTVDMASPDARAGMGNAYNNMMLQAKEAYNLGVLNGPDYDILQAVVKDPTKLTSTFTSNAAMANQAKELQRIAGDIEKRVLEAHGKPYKPLTPAANTAQLSGPDKQALDWANSNPSDPRAAAIKKKLGM